MLKLNKKNKTLKILNPKAFITILSAAAIAFSFSGCSNKKKEQPAQSNISTSDSSELRADEQSVPEVQKFTTIDKSSWPNFKKSVYDVSESKFNNDINIENLETALIILNMDNLKNNNLNALDYYFESSKGIDVNDEMNQLFKLLTFIREYNTNISNADEYYSFNNILLNMDDNTKVDATVINYLEKVTKQFITYKANLEKGKNSPDDEALIKSYFDEVTKFAQGTGSIEDIYQVDLSNDGIIASENIMQQISILAQNFISFEDRNYLDNALNSHNYIHNVEMNVAELNGHARPVADNNSVEILNKVNAQIAAGYDEIKSTGVTEEEFKALVVIANIDYFVKDVNNLVVFKSLYDNQIDIDELFEKAEAAVEKIQIYNASVKDSKSMYDYGHIYINSVTDIMNTKYVSKLSYSIIHSTGNEFDNAASKIKLFNQYSEELTETYTYNDETYKVSKVSISEGATQIINWISYYTYINNKSKFNNDEYVNNMIEFVDGSMPGLNPYEEIVLMTSDFCAKKNEGSYTYKIGE